MSYWQVEYWSQWGGTGSGWEEVWVIRQLNLTGLKQTRRLGGKHNRERCSRGLLAPKEKLIGAAQTGFFV